MTRTHRTRTISAPPQQLWETIRDPHHLPRWWPRVSRVEDVTPDAFTELLRTSGGKYVRADFTLVESDERTMRLCWAQCLQGSPFARLLKSAETEMRLAAVQPGEAAGAAAEGAPMAGGATGGGATEGAPMAGGAPTGAATGGVATATQVTIELRQTLNGILPRLGARMVRRAAARTIEEALDGLERIGV